MFTTGKKSFLAVMAFALIAGAGAFAEDFTTAEAKAEISRDRAQQIALDRVKGGQVVSMDFNDRWFRDNDYEFTVVDDTNRYDVQVDAKTGEVLKVNQKPIFNDNISANERDRVGSGAISVQRARSIAMDRVPNARIVDMTREMDSDAVVYDIEMRGMNTKVDMKVDGMSGTILSLDQETLENNDGMIRYEDRSFNRSVRSINTNVGDEVNRNLNNLNRDIDRSLDNVNRDINRNLNNMNDSVNRSR